MAKYRIQLLDAFPDGVVANFFFLPENVSLPKAKTTIITTTRNPDSKEKLIFYSHASIVSLHWRERVRNCSRPRSM